MLLKYTSQRIKYKRHTNVSLAFTCRNVC